MRNILPLLAIGVAVSALVYGIKYIRDPKCYDITIHAEGNGQNLDMKYQVQTRRQIDPALRRMQSLVPKELDVTRVDTFEEGRAWFCQD